MSVVADAVEVLDEGAEAVAVGADEHGAPGPQVGGDAVVPVREQPGDDVGEALRQRQLARRAPARSARRRWGCTRCRRAIGGGGTS